MPTRTLSVWTCPVCGTTKNKTGGTIRETLNRYNHLRWHERMHPGTVRKASAFEKRAGDSFYGFFFLSTLPKLRSPDK